MASDLTEAPLTWHLPLGKFLEQNKGLYVTFINLTKASDSVNRTGIWKIPEKLGCQPKFQSMVIQLHENQLTQVRHSNDLSQPFTIKNGMKQGCILAPTLITVFLSMKLRHATKDLEDEDCIYICFHTNSNLFNLKCLQAHT